MNWKVGDRCIIDCPHSMVHGQQTAILQTGAEGFHFGAPFIGYEVDIRCPKGYPWEFAIFEGCNLSPIPDDHARTKTKWRECPWQPEKVNVLA